MFKWLFHRRFFWGGFDVFNFTTAFGESDPHITQSWMCEHITFLFSVSTLVCHYMKHTMCWVILVYLGRNPAWNEHPGITRTRRRAGGSGYVTISLLWLISASSLSPSCCLSGCTGSSHDETCSKTVAMEAFPHRTCGSSQPLKYTELLSTMTAAFHIVLTVTVSFCCHPYSFPFVLQCSVCTVLSLELGLSPLFLSNNSRFDNWCREPFQTQRTGGR